METAKVRPAAPAATGLVLVGRAAGRPLHQRPIPSLILRVAASLSFTCHHSLSVLTRKRSQQHSSAHQARARACCARLAISTAPDVVPACRCCHAFHSFL